jgi:quercetin dioxygenase-like cupin family protein
MNHRFPRLLAGSLVVALLPLLMARADEPVPMQRLTPAEIDALAPGTGPGPRMVPLLGDSTKAGLYSVRVTIPAHRQVPPHTHRDNRLVTVVSGTWRVGYGTSFDEKALKTLPPGSFYTEPAGQPHFTAAGDEPVVIIVTGLGPSDTQLLGAPAARP